MFNHNARMYIASYGKTCTNLVWLRFSICSMYLLVECPPVNGRNFSKTCVQACKACLLGNLGKGKMKIVVIYAHAQCVIMLSVL